MKEREGELEEKRRRRQTRFCESKEGVQEQERARLTAAALGQGTLHLRTLAKAGQRSASKARREGQARASEG